MRGAQIATNTPTASIVIEASRCIPAMAREIAVASPAKAAKKSEMLSRSDCITVKRGKSHGKTCGRTSELTGEQ